MLNGPTSCTNLHTRLFIRQLYSCQHGRKSWVSCEWWSRCCHVMSPLAGTLHLTCLSMHLTIEKQLMHSHNSGSSSLRNCVMFSRYDTRISNVDMCRLYNLPRFSKMLLFVSLRHIPAFQLWFLSWTRLTKSLQHWHSMRSTPWLSEPVSILSNIPSIITIGSQIAQTYIKLQWVSCCVVALLITLLHDWWWFTVLHSHRELQYFKNAHW